MQRADATTVKPIEAPTDPDPLNRLVKVLEAEGFQPLHEDESWQAFGERVYRRQEKVLFASGDTVFLIIEAPALSDKVIRQAVESLSNLFRARGGTDKALSVLQSNTVYVCFVTRNELPVSINLARHINVAGGSVLIPVVIVPEINQVVYPMAEERVGTVTPRIEYLQYVLGERFERANIHKNTIQTMYVSGAIALLVIGGIVLSMFI